MKTTGSAGAGDYIPGTMGFDDELTRQGEALFRRRSWVPAGLLAPVLATAAFEGPGRLARDLPVLWPLACFLIGAAGLAARVITVGSVPGDTSGRNTVVGPRAAALNVTGPYSLVRNPLYAANYLLWLAPSLLPARWWLPVVTTLAYRLFYDRIILAEESFLRAKFGAEFDRWASRTPPLWPFGPGWRRRFVPTSLPFSARVAARREYPGLLAFGLSLTAVETALQYFATGGVAIGWPWLVLVGLVVAASAVLRWLNHRTRALVVDGR
jgi:protein-S-isoprenylcysteine O-methyltransferase Ste14